MKFIALLMTFILMTSVISSIPLSFAFEKPKWTTEDINSIRQKFSEQSSFREQIRKQIQKCKDSEDENCTAVNEAVQQLVKAVLLRICSKSENVFDRLIEKIENNPKLSDEEKETLKETLHNQKDKLDELCSRIEEADREELKEIVKEIRSFIKEAHIKFRIARKLVLLHRMGLVIERAEHLETKLDDFIEKWNCTNTTGIEELKEQFSEQITEARESYDESKNLWEEFINSVKSGNPDTEILREAQEKMQEAQSDLREVHITLKEIIQKLRECRETEETEEEEQEDNKTE